MLYDSVMRNIRKKLLKIHFQDPGSHLWVGSQALGLRSHLWDGSWVLGVGSHQQSQALGLTFQICCLYCRKLNWTFNSTIAIESYQKFWIVRHFNCVCEMILIISTICRSNHRRCSTKIGVLKNFAKFTGKHLCQSLLFK